MRLCTLAAAAMVFAGPALAQDPATMMAEIKNADGGSHGNATITWADSGMAVVTLDLMDVPPGVHGIHIHETGMCTPPDFKSAGGHLAGDHDHGVMSGNGPHPGDMPNIHVPESGALKVEYFIPGLTPEAMADEDGSALIIHDQPDDYVGQPSGNAGDRIACGVFEAAE